MKATQDWIVLERPGAKGSPIRQFVNLSLVRLIDVRPDGSCNLHFTESHQVSFRGEQAQPLLEWLKKI
jgi:hypothetical protein